MSGGTPIKFGPEWLRNFGGSGYSPRPNNHNRSGTSGPNSNGNQNSNAAGSSRTPTSTGLPTIQETSVAQQSQRVQPSLTSSSTSGAVPSSIPAASGVSGTQSVRQTNTPRVFMANLRYGREEMLALYDREASAPEELKHFDSLYQPRGKPPSALNAFEEEQSLQHDNARGGIPIAGGVPTGVGRGRGAVTSFGKRAAFSKAQVTGRGWNRPRMPGLNSGPPDDEPQSSRSWSTSNGAGPSRATPTEPSEWTQTKLFRNSSRRHVHNTNWRQSGREEGDEWRMQEHGSRSGNPERDWPERPVQDRQQSWGSNRRPWADNQASDENIPEWANDNAEPGAGTFDASGAFHGYSNDDSNIPRRQETPNPLARSNTHAAFTHSKTDEEGSDEWWASEKAKKLSPKRLFSSEYEKPSSSESNEPSTNRTSSSFDVQQEVPEMLNLQHVGSQNKSTDDTKNQYAESNTFDALMRSEIEPEEANDDRSNFQSVMLASNNTLRQKHQNIVASTADTTRRTMSYGMPRNHSEIDTTQTPEEKIAEDMLEMTLDESHLPMNMTSNVPHGASGGMCILQPISGVSPAIQIGIGIPRLQNQSMGINVTSNQVQNNIQNVGIQNSALNSSLGLPMGNTNNGVVLLQGVLPQVMTNTPMNPAMNATLQQHSNVMGAFQQTVPVIPTPNITNPSLYLPQNNNQQLPLSNGHPQNSEMQNNMFPMHGIQHGGPQQAQFSSIYRGVSTPTRNTPNTSLSELWYYEDPEKNIQGPFSSKEMWNWYGAGFFRPSLMVRRACETSMRPLASYGPMPFAQLDMFPLPVNQRPTLGIGVPINNTRTTLRADQLITVQVHPPLSHAVMERQICNISYSRMDHFPIGLPPPIIEPRTMDSLWSQPSTSQDGMWMQSSINRPESSVNNLPLYFWNSQPSAISSNTMLPEEIMKEMKTEDEILAQIRAPQNIPVSRISFSDDAASSDAVGIANSDDLLVNPPPIPDLTAFQKIMQPEGAQFPSPSATEVKPEAESIEEIVDKVTMPVETEPNNAKVPQPPIKVEPKIQKTSKNETDKAAKNKDNNGNKIKAKKIKDDKKDDTTVNTEEVPKKRSVESSPSKLLKDIKPPNKKEIEKEKKELIKDGFTIVKAAEKGNKKKADEAKAADEAGRKRKDEDKLAALEEKKKTLTAPAKKQQEQQQQKQASESVAKKAPWSAVATQAIATNKDGLSLTEIQKLEREKKLEQMKEQQQMMHIIAQQQAAALAREQEVQAGLGWAKKMNKNSSASSQTLAEIQSETRRQAAAATAAAAAQVQEEAQAAPVVATTHAAPWGNSSNGGFWDSPNQLSKADPVKIEPTKPVDINKNKMKAPAPLVLTSTKKETTPAMEFETWCSQALGFWSSKIDVPTFVGFLKDIESPYEVKDYVKCYLGESKDSSDFSRQFLERRSKLLRVGMVTPSDDLCSPALAINPRTNSMSDYQEVKGKGKKTKKNKMMKVDARILGFSVTAAEDRINVGDIDTA